jgi:hypothetical protein
LFFGINTTKVLTVIQWRSLRVYRSAVPHSAFAKLLAHHPQLAGKHSLYRVKPDTHSISFSPITLMPLALNCLQPFDKHYRQMPSFKRVMGCA